MRDQTEEVPRAARRRYGLLVIVEAESPRRAFEFVASPLLGPRSAGGKGVYVGAPFEGVPLAAREFGTESLTAIFDLPDGDGRRLRISAKLLPSS
jgi:hypothetical protein